MDWRQIFKICFSEERDAAGAISKRFYNRGQITSATNLFYDVDHQNSVREMTNNSGNIQALYAYSPDGKFSAVSETLHADFEYSAYYLHERSFLYLTMFRPYRPFDNRWIKRDPLAVSEFRNAIKDQISLATVPENQIKIWLSQVVNDKTNFAGRHQPKNVFYTYVNNNPVSQRDPSGLDDDGWDEKYFTCAAKCAAQCAFDSDPFGCFRKCYFDCVFAFPGGPPGICPPNPESSGLAGN